MADPLPTPAAVSPTAVPPQLPATAITHLPDNPNLLPPPLFVGNPALFARVQAYLWSPERGIRNFERMVLGAVLRNMPTPRQSTPATVTDTSLPATWLLDRILALGPTDLSLLARLFTVALLGARSWGGQLPAGHRTRAEVSEDPVAVFGPLFTTLGIHHLPPSYEPVAPSSTATHRSERQKENCMIRHEHRCPISLRKATSLTHAHIVPHSIVSDSNLSTSFWMLLTLILGPAMRDRFFDILGADAVYTTINSIVLTNDLHSYYDTGLLTLSPSPSIPSEPFDPQTWNSYNVVLHWWHDQEELDTWVTHLPINPDEQLTHTGDKFSHVVSAKRELRDRDQFRLFTNYPDRLPLVHPLLLDLHGVVWRMIIEAGLGQSVATHKRTLEHARLGLDDELVGTGEARGRGGRGRRGYRGISNKRAKRDHRSGGDTGEGSSRHGPGSQQQAPIHSVSNEPESHSLPTSSSPSTLLARESEECSSQANRKTSLGAKSHVGEGEHGDDRGPLDGEEVLLPSKKEQLRVERIRRQLYALESFSEGDSSTDDSSGLFSDNDGGEHDGGVLPEVTRAKSEMTKEHLRAEHIRRQLYALDSFSEGDSSEDSDDEYQGGWDEESPGDQQYGGEFPVPVTKEEQRAKGIRGQLYALDSFSEGDEDSSGDDDSTSEAEVGPLLEKQPHPNQLLLEDDSKRDVIKHTEDSGRPNLKDKPPIDGGNGREAETEGEPPTSKGRKLSAGVSGLGTEYM